MMSNKELAALSGALSIVKMVNRAAASDKSDMAGTGPDLINEHFLSELDTLSARVVSDFDGIENPSPLFVTLADTAELFGMAACERREERGVFGNMGDRMALSAFSGMAESLSLTVKRCSGVKDMPMSVSVKASGFTVSDLVEGLRETAVKVDEGYLSGFDGNDTGRYSFGVVGKEAEPPSEDGDER